MKLGSFGVAQIGVIVLTAMSKLTLPAMGIDKDAELTGLINAYCKFQFEEDVEWQVYGTVRFYQTVETWLATHGCRVDFFTLGMPKARWESNSKRVEFYLKWM